MSGQASVIFTAFDDLGTPIPAGAITLTGSYTYDGNDYAEERWNQVGKRTLDGKLNVEDNGIEITTIQVRVKSVLQADGYAFRDWIKGIIIYRRFRFDAAPQDPLLDIGAGLGVTVLKANLSSTSLRSMFKDGPPNNWEVNLPFAYRSA